MGQRSYQNVPGDPAVLEKKAETVVTTVAGISTARAGEQVRLSAGYTVRPAKGVKTVVHRIRRDNLKGKVVAQGEPDLSELAEGEGAEVAVSGSDAHDGEVAGAVYVLTVQQVGATGDGAVEDATIRADLG
jgi:hypothetical protein